MFTRIIRPVLATRPSLVGIFLASVFAVGCQPAQIPADTAVPVATTEAAPARSPEPIVPTPGITSIVIESAEFAFGGREFGEVGPYEWIDGEYTAEVDPLDPHNAVIVNIDRAPRNANGRVEYTAEFRI